MQAPNGAEFPTIDLEDRYPRIYFWVYRLVVAFGCISFCIIGPIACYVIFAYSGLVPEELPNIIDKIGAGIYAIGWVVGSLLLLIWGVRTSEEVKGHVYWTFQIPLILKCVKRVSRKLDR